MVNGSGKKLTDLADEFLLPSNPTHRQYEALRTFFVDRAPSAEAAERFGYTPGSFRVLCHEFRKNPQREFFLPQTKKAKLPPPRERLRQKIITLRKQNSSVYDIRDALDQSGEKLSPASISTILKEEGYARLPRRRDDERPATTRPNAADVADAGKLDLSERTFRTKVGGLFLFLPYLAKIPLDKMLADAKFPGTKMMPAAHAIRSLLAMKLFGSARHSHVMSYVFDEGLALFAGLNVIPKRSFLTEYSCRIRPVCYPQIMRSWFDTVKKLGLKRGRSLDLDFHTIPFHGEDALVQKHYISKRSRKQKGVLAFVAQDSETRVFCYANKGSIDLYQVDIPPIQPETWKFVVGHGHCQECGRRVRGQHPLLISKAFEVGTVHFGPRLLAFAAFQKMICGVSYDKIRLGFEQMLGFPVARSTLCRAMQRLARRAKRTRDALVEALRASPVVYADETGWKQGGRRVWLWVFTNLRETVYEILPGRGFEQAASVLGKNYAGTLGVDGWAPYRCFKEATLQTCYNHLLHRCHELLETATRGAVRFPRLVKAILRHALALRDRRDAGESCRHKGIRVIDIVTSILRAPDNTPVPLVNPER